MGPLVINTPHNPTGHHFTESELRWILETAEGRGIQVLVDEAYRGAEYRDEDRLPTAALLSEKAGVLGLLSKGYGLPGLRLAWLATRNPELREAVARAKDYTTICAPAPVEFLATLALRHSQVILGRNRKLLVENLASLRAFMEVHADALEFIPPKAGSICLPVLRRGDAEAFARRLREEAGILVAPGSLLGAAPNAFRMGFGRRSFPEGLERMDAWMRSQGAG